MQWIAGGLIVLVMIGGSVFPVTAQSAKSGASPLDNAEAAVQQMASGDYSGAAKRVRQALEATPDDPDIGATAGALLLFTGDRAGAQSAFSMAMGADPGSSLAIYGAGLAQMAQGSRIAALNSFDRSEQAGGDKSDLLIARRYAQWLEGAQVALQDAGLPETLLPAQSALEGMDAARHTDWARARTALETAQATLPGDPILQAQGLAMTFEPARPLEASAPRLPAGSLTIAPRKDTLSGSVEFSPGDQALDGVAYVSYELDGKPLGLVNVRPFHYNWDTGRASNGWHTLSVILYDPTVHEISKTTRKIRIFNAGGRQEETEQRVRLRTALWQMLGLVPDRCACAYMTGMSYRAQGELQQARRWFARAAAIHPDYRDVRQQLAACGGIGEAGDPLWGGLTSEKVVALTFDDGPKPGVTEPLLDVLRQERVPATFFVIGKHVVEYPELTKQIVDSGMELANHSYTHRNLTKLSDAEVAREMLETQAAIQAVTGKAPRFVRPPGGNWNSRVAQTARKWGLTACMWTVDVYGSEVIGAQQVADAVLRQVHPGSIILMHNGKVSTLQALPTILRELRARGYAFATVDTLSRRLGAAKMAARSNGENVPRRIE